MQLLLEFSRLNRRMHNKCFIVDNDEAVIGGRNIGDGYFNAAADNNFRDLDVLAIGPAVPAATRSFENYWNSDAAQPIAKFRSGNDPAVDLVAVRAGSREGCAYSSTSPLTNRRPRTTFPRAHRPIVQATGTGGRQPWWPIKPEKTDPGPERTDLRISPNPRS